METLVASFDIGSRNFAFCIEKFDSCVLTNYKNTNKDERYNEDGTCKSDFSEILNNVYKNGELVIFCNNDLLKGKKSTSYVDSENYYNMYELLEKYKSYFDKCDVILIEQQMSFGAKKYNTLAVKLGQHCMSYFIYKYGKTKKVIEYPAYYKTITLGAPKVEKILKSGKKSYKAMDKAARKKWSIIKCEEILKIRDDDETMKNLKTKKKKDDLSDVLIQLQSFKFLYYVENMKFK